MPLTATSTPENCDKKGSDFALYYNTGVCATPVWVEHVGLSGDLNFGEVEDEDELPIRDSAKLVKEYTEGKIDIQITGETVVDLLYVGNQTLHSARSGGSPVDFAALTGPITEVGAYGWRGKMRNYDRSASGPNTGPATGSFNLRPAACTDCDVRAVTIEVSGTVANDDRTTVATPWGSDLTEIFLQGVRRAMPAPNKPIFVQLSDLYDVFTPDVVKDLVQYSMTAVETVQRYSPRSVIPLDQRQRHLGLAAVNRDDVLAAAR